MPERIQLRRVRGWRIPPCTVIVDRRTKWGNPFEVVEAVHPDYPVRWYVGRRDSKGIMQQLTRYAEDPHSAAVSAVAMFRAHLLNGELKVTEEDVKRELRGKTLACWCRVDSPCHGDALLRIANEVVDG